MADSWFALSIVGQERNSCHVPDGGPLFGTCSSANDEQVHASTEGDELVTFSVLVTLGMLASAILIYLGSVFKLANLGTYLPFPVLCGFFSAVGILLWQLAISIDTNGAGLSLTNAHHHLPSLVMGLLMKWLGPKNPLMVTGLVVATVIGVYLYMFLFGVSLEQA